MSDNPAHGILSPAQKLATGFAAVFLFSLPLPHAIALRQIVFVAAFAITVIYLRTSLPAWRQIPLTKPFIAWLILAALSLIWAVDPGYSLREVKSEIVYGAATLYLFYALTQSAVQLRIFLWALLVALIAGALSALFTRYRSGNIVDAALLYNGIGSYSTFVVALLPFLILTWINARRIASRFALAAIAPLVLAPLWLSFTRNAWFALAISLFTSLALLAAQVHIRHIRTRLLIALAIACALAPVLLLHAMANRLGIDANIEQVALATASNDPRPALWTFVVEKIAERPWTGYGFGERSFTAAFPHIAEENSVLWHTHNLVLEYGFQLGVLGIALLVWMFGAVTREFWRLYRCADRRTALLGAAGIALIAGVLAKSMTDIFFYRENALLFWALVGITLGYARNQINREQAGFASGVGVKA